MLYINVKQLLESQQHSRYWLVKNMNSDYKTISDIIDNKTSRINFDTIEKLCILLHCTPNDIFKFAQSDSDDDSNVS